MSLQLELIRSLETLEGLRDEWWALFESAADTPFQSPAWIAAWWRFFGNDRLWTVVLRQNRELVALFPLYIEVKDTGCRELKFIGAGVSDCLDGLMLPRVAGEACQALFECMEEHSIDWDCCHFEQLSLRSSLLKYAGGVPRVPAEPCQVVELPSSLEEWHALLSPSLKEDIYYSRRRICRKGSVRFSVADSGTVNQYFDIFMSLHLARWNLFTSPSVRHFHRKVVNSFLAAGLLRLYRMDLNGEPASCVYGFTHQKRFYIYLTAFDPAFAKLSVGSLAINEAVERAIGENCLEADFLRGDEAYKLRFGASPRLNASLHCNRAQLKFFREEKAASVLNRFTTEPTLLDDRPISTSGNSCL